MQGNRFDTLVTRLHVTRSRREGLRILLAGLVSGLSARFAGDAAATDCLGKDRSCKKNADCCSGICKSRSSREDARTSGHRVAAEGKGKKGKKGKSKKKNKRKARKDGPRGGCDCSGLQERCNDADDCCQDAFFCERNPCESHARCCKDIGAPCDGPCDCCGTNSFCDDEMRCDTCGELKQTRRSCTTTDECCFADDVCESIDPACEGRAGEKQCCVPRGLECEEDCDCCAPAVCALGKCATGVGCSDSGESCSLGSSGQCCTGDLCLPVVCEGEDEPRCCRPAGPCEDDCDCCGPVECLNGRCGGT
jgi:hypothetical protein